MDESEIRAWKHREEERLPCFVVGTPSYNDCEKVIMILNAVLGDD
jgi:hypothetical protein